MYKVVITSNWTCISFDYICTKSMLNALSIELKGETNNVFFIFALLYTSRHMKYISLQVRSIVNTNRPMFRYIWVTNWCDHYLFLHHCYDLWFVIVNISWSEKCTFLCIFMFCYCYITLVIQLVNGLLIYVS